MQEQCPYCGNYTKEVQTDFYTIVKGKRMVLVDDKEIKLPPILYKIIKCLHENTPNLVTEPRLYNVLFGEDPDPPLPSVMQTHITRCRNLLKGTGLNITNVWGEGWRMEYKKPPA